MKTRSHVSPSFWFAAALFLGVGGSMGCSAGDEPMSDEEATLIGETTQALTPVICASSSSKACWERRGSDQQRHYSYFNLTANTSSFPKVMARLNGGDYSYKMPFFQEGSTPLGYVTHVSGLPNNIVSITAFSNGTSGTVQLLTSASDIYSVSGKLPPPSPNGVDWAKAIVEHPVKSSGSSLCLAELDSVMIPAPTLGSFLIGLGCDGKLYYKQGSWRALSERDGYAGLPTNVTYKHFSRMGSEPGATFVTSSNEVWMAGSGSFDTRTSSVIWKSAKKLPTIKSSSGATLTATSVGGRYALTNAGNGTCTLGQSCDGDTDRIYWYDATSNSWRRFSGGLPWYPQSLTDLGYCSSSMPIYAGCDPKSGGTRPADCGTCYPVNPAFADIQQLGGSGQSSVAMYHKKSWVFRWRG